MDIIPKNVFPFPNYLVQYHFISKSHFKCQTYAKLYTNYLKYSKRQYFILKIRIELSKLEIWSQNWVKMNQSSKGSNFKSNKGLTMNIILDVKKSAVHKKTCEECQFQRMVGMSLELFVKKNMIFKIEKNRVDLGLLQFCNLLILIQKLGG